MRETGDQLVGRAAEVNVLDQALVAIEDGDSALLLITGEPGIGKTRLLAELAGRADARGCTVLDGSGSELESDLPFGIFVDALNEYLAGQDPRLVAALGEDARRELGLVLPSLADAAVDGGPVMPDERYRSHRAMRELLERLAATRPLVLLLDDVHWADAASAELLATLARTPPDAAVLVVVAARPRQLPERLVAALERAGRAGGVHRIELSGLPRDAVAQLLGDGVATGRADELFRETGGNPFYLQQLARSSGTAGDAPAAESALSSVGVPATVIASLTEELALLSDDALRLVRGAAVAGDPFQPEVAAAAADATDAAAMEALDELLELGIVGTTEIPRRFRFRHPLVRRAVYESAPGGWLLGAHERCAALLVEAGASPVARAHHVEYSGRPGDMEAVKVLAEAGHTAVLRAPGSATRWFSAALRLLPAGAHGEERLDILLARARALAAQGRLAEAHADLLEAIALLPEDAVALRIRLATTCAGVERLLGSHQEAHERLLEILERLPDDSGPDAVALMIELAVDAVFRADREAVGEWAGRALGAARDLGQPPLVAAAASMVALGRAVAGSTAEARVAYAEATALLARLTDDELAVRVDAAAYLASTATYLDLYDDAVAHAERALRVGRAAGHLHPTLLPALGAAHFMRGRLDEATTVLDGGVEAARLAGVTQGMAWMLRNGAFLAAAKGDIAGALDLAEEALELTAGLDESVLSSWAAMAVAQAAAMAGDNERVIEVAGDSGHEHAFEAIPGTWRGVGFEALARALADLGRLDEAAVVVTAAEEHAAALDLPLATVWARRAAARVSLQTGEHARAAEEAAASVAAAEEAGALVEGALSRMVAARALAAAGEKDAAIAELEEAGATFERCGAAGHRKAVDQELRGLGRRVHRRTRAAETGGAGLGSLTERERQIADLVVDRKTNPEIAGELYLSPKTVETHLSNIFRKVGVSSRVELARAVERAARRDA